MKSKIKLLTLSLLTILCCTALVVVGTAALFTGSDEVDNTITSGNLDFTFARTAYTAYGLNTDGFISELETEAPAKDAISMAGIAPGGYVEATYKIANTGTTAFKVAIALTAAGVGDNTAEAALMDAFKITVTVNGSKTVLNEASFSALDSVDLETVVKATQNATFTIKIAIPEGEEAFFDESEDNKFMDANFAFTLKLSLVQVVSAPVSGE